MVSSSAPPLYDDQIVGIFFGRPIVCSNFPSGNGKSAIETAIERRSRSSTEAQPTSDFSGMDVFVISPVLTSNSYLTPSIVLRENVLLQSSKRDFESASNKANAFRISSRANQV